MMQIVPPYDLQSECGFSVIASEAKQSSIAPTGRFRIASSLRSSQ